VLPKKDSADDDGFSNRVMGDFLADAEALLAVRLERVSLDDAPTHSTRSLPCNDEPC
jgi:hypothetical protein